MAKTNMLEREKNRAELAKKFAKKRKALKATIVDPNASYDDKMAAVEKLQKLPRDSSPTPARYSCALPTNSPSVPARIIACCAWRARSPTSTTSRW